MTILGTSFKWNYTVFVFHDWLISLSIACLRFIHGVACVRTALLFKAERHSAVWMDHILFIRSSVRGHLECFHVWVANTCSRACFPFSWGNTQRRACRAIEKRIFNLIKPARLFPKWLRYFSPYRGGGLFAGVGNSLRITQQKEFRGNSADSSWCGKGN